MLATPAAEELLFGSGHFSDIGKFLSFGRDCSPPQLDSPSPKGKYRFGMVLPPYAVASARRILSTILLEEISLMPEGTVKKLVSEKGFGFISGDKGDVFFHHSSVEGSAFESLQVGQTVSYEIEQGKGGKGPRAVNVKPV